MRLYAFDNLRLASIFIVVVFHAMCAYTANADWWYVNIQDGERRFLLFMGLADTFVMSTMFFVAGFFASKSHRNTSNNGYLKQRLKRLLLPGYLQLLLVCPLLFFLPQASYSWSELAQIYQATWGTLFQFQFKTIQPGSMSFHHHIWFVEVLFVIGAVFMLTRHWTNSFLLANDQRTSLIATKLFLMMLAGCIIIFIALQMGLRMHDWQNIGGLIMGQTARFGAYFAAYAIGLYIYGLYQEVALKRIFQASCLAIVSFLVFGLLMFLAAKLLVGTPLAGKVSLAAGFILVCFFLLFMSTFLFLKFINRKYRWIAPLYPLNYGIYLMHMVYVVALQRLLVSSDLDIGLQVVIISSGAFLLSVVSTYLKQRLQQVIEQKQRISRKSPELS